MRARNLTFFFIFISQLFYYDFLYSQQDTLFFDDFKSPDIDTNKWWIVHGVPIIENGYLELISNFSNREKTEIQSISNLFFCDLEIKAYFSHWASEKSDTTIDTSIGLEFYYPDKHQGIVITNGHLGVLNSPIEEYYKEIPGWDTLRTKENIYKISWSNKCINFFINDKLIISNISILDTVIPDRELKIRLNCNVDMDYNKNIETDTLKIDYVIVKNSTCSNIKSKNITSVSEFILYPNYPNPFNSSTIISYQILKNSNIEVNIYNIEGQKIQTLVNDYQKIGRYCISWDGKNENGYMLPSGVYFIELLSNDFSQIRKTMFLK